MHQLEIKVLDIVGARCNNEVYPEDKFPTLLRRDIATTDTYNLFVDKPHFKTVEINNILLNFMVTPCINNTEPSFITN